MAQTDSKGASVFSVEEGVNRSRGLFWLPDQPQGEVVGELRVSSGFAEVDLAEPLPAKEGGPWEPDRQHVPIVHGILDEPLKGSVSGYGRDVTLVDCAPSRWKMDFGERSGYATVGLRVRHAFVGLHLTRPPRSDSVYVSFDRLAEWFADTGLHYEVPDSPPWEPSIGWRQPAAIAADLGTGLSVRVVVPSPKFTASIGPEAHLRTTCWAQLDAGLPASAGEWYQEIERLSHFLAFVVGRRVDLTHLALRLPMVEARGRRKAVVDAAAVRADEIRRDWRPDRHFLPRNAIPGLEGVVLCGWWALARRLGPALPGVINETCRTTSYELGQFLRLAAAAEAYHASISAVSVRGPEVADAISVVRKAIKSSVPDSELRRRLYNHMQGFERGPTYAERLDDLVERVGSISAEVVKWDGTTTRDVKELRDFLAHGMSRDRPLALRSAQVFVDLVKKLQAVLRCNILLDIGLSRSDSENVMNQAYGPNRWFS